MFGLIFDTKLFSGAVLCCFWCCAPPPPPGPGQQTVVVIDGSGSTGRANYREIKALEYRDGDPAVRYYLTIPPDIQYDQAIQVDLGGRVMTVRIPDYIRKGEKVIVVAPAPVS